MCRTYLKELPMNVQISIRHMQASDVSKQSIRILCGEIINRHEPINNIDVKIEDINGPHKAGIDKRCHLKVRGKNHLAIDVDDIDSDINHAIDNAFRRLKKILKRKHLPGNELIGHDDHHPIFILEA